MKFLSMLAVVALALAPVAFSQSGSNLPNAPTTMLTATAPVNGTNEIQTVTFGGTPTGGTFRLSFQGKTTGAITWTATDATLVSRIDTALEALATIGTGGVTTAAGTVSSGIGTVTVTFTGNQAKLAVPLMTSASSLTGTSPTLAVTETTPGVTADGRYAAKGQLIEDKGTPGLWQNTSATALNPAWSIIPTAVDVVPASLFDAETILAATADNTPLALTVGANTVVGRKASGDISAMSITETLTMLGGNSAPTGTGILVRATAPTITGAIVTPKFTTITGDGAITIASGTVDLAKTSAAAITLAAPSSQDGTEITIIGTTAFAHVVTVTGGLWDGTATTNTTATFPVVQGGAIRIIAKGTAWYVESLNGVVCAP